MNVTKCDSLLVAEQVLNAFILLVKNTDVSSLYDLSVGSYQNGREQGLSVSTYGFYASFAECRNSDSIVVYNAEYDPMQSISDEMYKNLSSFSTPAEAAEFIRDQFIFAVGKQEAKAKQREDEKKSKK